MNEFWLTAEQFARISPRRQMDTRGKERNDDRRVISGIIHVMKSIDRWSDAPHDVYELKKTLYNRFVRWAVKGGLDPSVRNARAGGRPALSGADRFLGRSRGGRTTEIHALTDRFCYPIAFLLTGGQVPDCKAPPRSWSACLPAASC